MDARIYFYNDVEFMPNEDITLAKDEANKRLNEALLILDDYEKWKQSVKAFNKFITVKFRKLDYSRFAHKKELKRIFDKREELSNTDDMHKFVQIAYPDAFYHNNIHYYPVNFPQTFKIKSDNAVLTKVLHSKDEAIKYFENYENNDILDIETSEPIGYKPVANTISEFFDLFKNGIIYITNEINSGR